MEPSGAGGGDQQLQHQHQPPPEPTVGGEQQQQQQQLPPEPTVNIQDQQPSAQGVSLVPIQQLLDPTVQPLAEAIPNHLQVQFAQEMAVVTPPTEPPSLLKQVKQTDQNLVKWATPLEWAPFTPAQEVLFPATLMGPERSIYYGPHALPYNITVEEGIGALQEKISAIRHVVIQWKRDPYFFSSSSANLATIVAICDAKLEECVPREVYYYPPFRPTPPTYYP